MRHRSQEIAMMKSEVAKRKETHKLAQAVAEHLVGFYYDSSKQRDRDGELLWWGALENAEDARVTLRPDRNPERILIDGHIPTKSGYAYGGKRPKEISVARSRGPKIIAREIEHRFLPRYLPLYEAACKQRERTERGEREGRASVQRLADLCGQEMRDRGDSWGFYLFGNDSQGDFRSGEVTRHLMADVAIKLSGLSEQQAAAVLKAAGFTKGGERI